jgi:oligopeptide/dipeptide ABC transporter ATP-binding protein
VPVPDPSHTVRRLILEGDVPSPVAPPPGCHFHPRCRYAVDVCKTVPPRYREFGEGHFAACHRSEELNLQPIHSADRHRPGGVEV